jgi:hypothetical protein
MRFVQAVSNSRVEQECFRCETPFLRHFYITNAIILPRQARDKHRESSTQKERVDALFAGWFPEKIAKTHSSNFGLTIYSEIAPLVRKETAGRVSSVCLSV